MTDEYSDPRKKGGELERKFIKNFHLYSNEVARTHLQGPIAPLSPPEFPHPSFVVLIATYKWLLDYLSTSTFLFFESFL
ncbi:unnamed protein product [Onchocerca flexuosa]|uniref:Uncharacterized protein n=1 Tax=Onchocerca flexuosa TaxID=387005 RepID=A0A183H149_9BILA|nr:unnamed protein product [Onchocerca flexuosa]